MLRLTIILTTLLFSVETTMGQQQPDTSGSSLQSLQEQFKGTTSHVTSSAGKVTLETKLSQNVVPAGSSFKAAIFLNIDKNWHINAHEPSLDYLIGTSVSLVEQSGISVTNITYPESKTLTFEFAREALDVYEGAVPIILEISTSDSLKPSSYNLTGRAKVQACNNNACLAPSNLEISLPVEITPSGTGYQALNKDLFKNFRAEQTSLTDTFSAGNATQIAQLFDDLGYFWAFTGIFLIGLALNLTPCVYPMLSVTVSLFGGQSENSKGLTNSAFMATVYVLGIIFMYSILGITAAYTGSLFGSWLQSSWILGGIGLLILALSASMFGLYELQPPQWMVQKFSGMQRSTSTAGHFLSGLFVGIFAAPCVGPPIIALLAFVGSQGDPVFGFITLFIMASGLSFPYLILGTFSGLLGSLPKSGMWMVWVKKIFGVILVGVGLFYLALALFPDYATHTIPAVLIMGGIYLGLTSNKESQGLFNYMKWSVGVLSVIAGLLFIQNLSKTGIQWKPYSEQAYQQAIKDKQPIILDFYADWCVPCLEMERVTYTNQMVIEATENFKRFKVDLTQYESNRAEKLRNQFEVRGVPTIVFINKNGAEEKNARIVGFVKPQKFLQQVEQVES